MSCWGLSELPGAVFNPESRIDMDAADRACLQAFLAEAIFGVDSEGFSGMRFQAFQVRSSTLSQFFQQMPSLSSREKPAASSRFTSF